MQAMLYANELASCPLWAIKQACKAFSSGKIGSLDFVPSAARIADYIRPLVSKYRAEASKIALALEAPVIHDEPTPEEREALSDSLSDLAKDLRSGKDSDRPKRHNDMTPEEAEAFLAKPQKPLTPDLAADLDRLMAMVRSRASGEDWDDVARNARPSA